MSRFVSRTRRAPLATSTSSSLSQRPASRSSSTSSPSPSPRDEGARADTLRRVPWRACHSVPALRRRRGRRSWTERRARVWPLPGLRRRRVRPVQRDGASRCCRSRRIGGRVSPLPLRCATRAGQTARGHVDATSTGRIRIDAVSGWRLLRPRDQGVLAGAPLCRRRTAEWDALRRGRAECVARPHGPVRSRRRLDPVNTWPGARGRTRVGRFDRRRRRRRRYGCRGR